MGHNLPRKYRFNQRTMGFVKQENSQAQYSTYHLFWKKKVTWHHLPRFSQRFAVLCPSLVEPIGGGRSRPSPPPRWLLGFMEVLGTRMLRSSSEGVNLPPGTILPTGRGRDLGFNQIRESENTDKFIWLCPAPWDVFYSTPAQNPTLKKGKTKRDIPVMNPGPLLPSLPSPESNTLELETAWPVKWFIGTLK